MAGGEGSVSPQKAALAAAVLIVSFLSYGVLQVIDMHVAKYHPSHPCMITGADHDNSLWKRRT